MVVPRDDMLQVLERPIRPGAVYPVLFLTREEFEGIELPAGSRRFVVIRDLRDTLVSLYFSFRFSHVVNRTVAERRARLERLSKEEGLLYLMDGWLEHIANIQRSWVGGGDEPIRFEDLLARDVEILERVLVDEVGLGVPREKVREAIVSCRFERLSGGRARGAEDQSSHIRKGIAGDWRNHFTDRVTEAFKERFGEHLVVTGYEESLEW